MHCILFNENYTQTELGIKYYLGVKVTCRLEASTESQNFQPLTIHIFQHQREITTYSFKNNSFLNAIIHYLQNTV